MRQDYEFFDGRAFDPIWEMSWPDFIRAHKTRWAVNRHYKLGEYNYRSVRELIAVSFEPQPPAEEIEHILKHRSVRWTIRHSSPQLFVMSCIMSEGLPHLGRKRVWLETSVYADCLLAAAVDAYFGRRITRATLRAVLKLHSVADAGEFLKLTRKEKKTLRDGNLTRAMWKPIYAWQGLDWLVGEECANALAYADTKRFIDFVIRAWDENWPTPRIMEVGDQTPSGNPRFREFGIAQELAKQVKGGVRDFERPCVFRQWA